MPRSRCALVAAVVGARPLGGLGLSVVLHDHVTWEGRCDQVTWEV